MDGLCGLEYLIKWAWMEIKPAKFCSLAVGSGEVTDRSWLGGVPIQSFREKEITDM